MAIHICYVEHGYPHPHGGGGAGTYVQLVGNELVRLGHAVSVIASHCPECPGFSEDQGVKVFRPRFQGNLHWYLNRIPGLRTFALTGRSLEYSSHLDAQIQLIHKQNSIDLIEFTEGGSFWHSRRSSIPFISHLHGSRYTFLKMSGGKVSKSDQNERLVGLSAIRRADWVVSPSQSMLEIVQEEAGCQFTRASVIPYPIEPSLLVEPHYLNKNEEKIVFFAARNDPVKGADTLLASVPAVTVRYPQVRFHFYGYQPEPGEIIPNNVDIFPFLPKAELIERMRDADICVIPSIWDNSPNTVYEAMAAGKAVVASRVGGIPELVVDGETGLLVESGDAQQLAQGIIRLLSDDRERERMGRNGRQRIKTIASLEENVDRRLEIYHQVIQQVSH